jgi:hypothetical protein
MRAREFLRELKLDIPDQMVSVQIPLSTINGQKGVSLDGEDSVDNPGKRIDSLGSIKWSPPLQQHLDAVKDSVGPSDQAVSVDPEEGSPEAEQHSPHAGAANEPAQPVGSANMMKPVQGTVQPQQTQQPARRIPVATIRPGVLG